jgi:hypothetical protein
MMMMMMMTGLVIEDARAQLRIVRTRSSDERSHGFLCGVELQWRQDRLGGAHIARQTRLPGAKDMSASRDREPASHAHLELRHGQRRQLILTREHDARTLGTVLATAAGDTALLRHPSATKGNRQSIAVTSAENT